MNDVTQINCACPWLSAQGLNHCVGQAPLRWSGPAQPIASIVAYLTNEIVPSADRNTKL